jgi:uncharacterized protein YukE
MDKEENETSEEFFGFLEPSAVKKAEEKAKGNPFKSEKKEEEVKEEKKETTEDYKERYERLKRFEDPTFEELKSIVDSFEGETLQEKFAAFKKFNEEAKEKLPKVEQLEKETREKELKLRDIDIRSSREWQEKAEAPMIEADEVFSATIADVDDEGNIKNRKYFDALYAEILNKGEEINSTKIKAILTKFAKVYEDKTGEEYKIPDIDSVIKARNALIKAAINRRDMYANWEKEKEQREQQALIEGEKKHKELSESHYAERRDQFTELSRDFDFSSLSQFVKEDEIKSELRAIFEENEKALKGEVKSKSYKTLLENSLKAALFDKILNQAKLDRNFVTEFKGGETDSKDSSGGGKSFSKEVGSKKVNLFDLD